MAMSAQQRKANRRLGLGLAVLALTFGAVFVVKMVFIGL